MRYWDKVILFLEGLIILSSCGSSKKVVYLQDADVNRRVKTEIEYKTVIHPDDLLSIVVS